MQNVQNIKITTSVLRRVLHDDLRLLKFYSSEAYPDAIQSDIRSLSTSLSTHISNFTINNLSDVAIYRSKRMILDCFGVGVIGAQTDVAGKLRHFAKLTDGIQKSPTSSLWGVKDKRCPAPLSAYINGASCHAMDFDDTWHPATHPSSPVLPAILAVATSLPLHLQPNLQDALIAFNVGIEVQGILLKCSSHAINIPNRLHPPAIVGVLGSAAAVSRLLGFGPEKCRHAMAIATSFAGAPMANAGTTTKPLHSAKAARFGLEAALLSDNGIEGNADILDISSGFSAYFDDFDTEEGLQHIYDQKGVILHEQDVAIKRFPCHLGMHWAIDAAMSVHKQMMDVFGYIPVDAIKDICITAPKSKYIDRPIPKTEHDARHSFQFTTCTALIDGTVSPSSFLETSRTRESLHNVMTKTFIHCPEDNLPSFAMMYVEVKVSLTSGQIFRSRCDTPYGHWNNPLSDNDVISKFVSNTSPYVKNSMKVVNLIKKMSPSISVSELEHELH